MPHHLQMHQANFVVEQNTLENRQDNTYQGSLRETYHRNKSLRDDIESRKDLEADFVETPYQKQDACRHDVHNRIDGKPIAVHDSPQQLKLQPVDYNHESVLKLDTTIYTDKMKPKDEAKEKELVNGALIALVSLASRPTAGSNNELLNNLSVNTPRERKVQTPSPPQDMFLSMVTPSNSSVTTHMLNSTSQSTSRSLDIVTEVASHSSPSCAADSKAEEYNHLDRASIKHPLCLPGVIVSPHGRHQGQYRLSPKRRYRSLPILDKHSFDEPCGYNMTMKKGSDMYQKHHSDFNYQEDNNHLPGPDQSHWAEVMARSRRDEHFCRVHFDSGRRAYYDYDSDTLTHPRPQPIYRQGGFHHHRQESNIYDYPSEDQMRERVYVDTRRGQSIPRYYPVRHELGDITYAVNEHHEEKRQQYHYARSYHYLNHTYCSRSHHYYPTASRAHHEDYTRPKHLTQADQFARVYATSRSEGDDRIQIPMRTSSIGHGIVVGCKRFEYPANTATQGNVKKTVLKRKCAWKNYPELEAFLIENREEYLKYSAKNYTIEQKQYNNQLTERLLNLAAKHNYIFDPNDFNFVAVRDRIRCYYKSYVQSKRKRGIVVRYDAIESKKKQKIETEQNELSGRNTVSSAREGLSSPEVS